MRLGGRHSGTDRESGFLAPVDPSSGELLETAQARRLRPVRYQPTRRRWLCATAVLAASAAATVALSNQSGARQTATTWTDAKVEVAAASSALDQLASVGVEAATSDPRDPAQVDMVRRATASETATRLRRLRRHARPAVVPDSKLRALQRAVDQQIGRWIEAFDGTVSSGVSPTLSGAQIDAIDRRVRSATGRWRTSPAPAADPIAHRRVDGLVARLRRPTDVPIPATATVITSGGERIDADLRTGEVRRSRLEWSGRASPSLSPPFAHVGSQLLIQSTGGPAALPIQPSTKVAEAGDGHLSTRGIGVWQINDEGPGLLAHRLDADVPDVSPPVIHGDFLGATRDAVIYVEYADVGHGHDVRPQLWREATKTRQRVQLPYDSMLLDANDEIEVWTKYSDGSILLRSHASDRNVDLPAGWSAHEATIGQDSSVVLTLSTTGPTGRSSEAIGVLRAGSSSVELLHVAMFVNNVSVYRDWVFWLEPVRESPQVLALRARNLAGGDVVPIRLPSTSIVAVVAHDGGRTP